MNLPELKRRVETFIRMSGPIRVSSMVCAFLLPTDLFWPIKGAAFAVLGVSLGVKIYKKELKFDKRDWSNLAIGSYLLIALLSAILSPYRPESFRAFIALLCQGALYLALVSEYDGFDSLRPFFISLFAGFALHTLGIAYLVLEGGQYFASLREFSYYAALYAPLALAYLLTSGNDMKEKRRVVYMCAPGLLLALYSGSVAMVAAVLASFGYVLVLSGRFKFFSAFAAVFVGVAVIFFVAASPARTTVDAIAAAHAQEAPFFKGEARREKERAHWKMTLDLIMERPFLGYGYGQDRFRSAASSAGYLNGIDRTGETYAFFDRGYLRASGSHNGFVESLFEVGLFGTLAYVFFWLTVVRKTKGIFLVASKNQGAVFLRLGVTGFLLSALALSMTESILGGRIGAVLMAVAGAGVILFKEFDALPKNYRTVWVFDRRSN